MVGAEVAPLVIVVDGAVFFTGAGADSGGGATTTGSAGSGSCGSAEVIVVADVGAIVGAAMGGSGGDDGICGVDNTATVTPKSIIPATATTHVIVLRTPFRRGTSTVLRSCDDVWSRRLRFGAGAASRPGAGALRPE